MRRKDKEVTGRQEIIGIIAKCKICRLGLCLNDQPYVIPVNFGYTDADGKLTLFIHGAKQGKKLEMLAKNPNVCVELDIDYGVLAAADACDYGYGFESVVCQGTASPVEDGTAKREALGVIMRHVTGSEEDFAFSENAVHGTSVYRIEVTEFTGKRKLPV